MNINKLPGTVRNDIEMQLLLILEEIACDIVVIGGWAVRAHACEKHVRHTIDIDGFTEKNKLNYVKNRHRFFHNSMIFTEKIMILYRNFIKKFHYKPRDIFHCSNSKTSYRSFDIYQNL